MDKTTVIASIPLDFVNPKTGRRYRIGGCIPSEKPSTAQQFDASEKYMANDLPWSVDLRPYMTHVENQEDSCSWSVKYFCLRNMYSKSCHADVNSSLLERDIL